MSEQDVSTAAILEAAWLGANLGVEEPGLLDPT